MGLAETALVRMGGAGLRVSASRCTRPRSPRSGARCSTCAELCPAAAIRVTDGAPTIAESCNGCGTCFSACPTGAFTLSDGGDEVLIRSLTRRVAGGALRISCERGDVTAEVLLPCLGRLTETVLLAAIRNGLSVRVARPECARCPNAKAERHIDATLSCARALLEMLGIAAERLTVQGAPMRASALRREKTVTRRELFSALRRRAADVTAASPDGSEGSGDSPNGVRKPVNPRRSLLLEQLAGLRAVKEVRLPSGGSIVGEITVSARCTACASCAAMCPTGALSATWGEGSFSLGFTAALCTNCDMCRDACRPGALTLREVVRLEALLERDPTILFTAATRTCTTCRTPFAPDAEQARAARSDLGGSDLCPACRDRKEKQAEFIRKGFMSS